VTALRDGLADRQVPPIEAALRILDHELAGLTSLLASRDDPSQDDPGRAAVQIRRFGDLIRATPSLRAYQSDMIDQFVSVATEILAARAGVSAADPEPQIAARALLGLWHVQADSLRRHLARSPMAAQVREGVAADVHRAARLIDDGLRSFATPAPPGETR
jgi:MftR C-terminal domain